MGSMLRHLAISFTGLLLLAPPAVAQDDEEEERGWSNETELSFVSTSGNSEGTTFGFKNKLRRTWDGSELYFDVSGLRAESTTFRRFAVSEIEGVRVVEEGTSELTAENYRAVLGYEREISSHLYWYGLVSWERDEFAGIANRYLLSAGVGHDWWEAERSVFKTSYGLSYTDQEDVVDNPDRVSSFAGIRLTADFHQELTATTAFDNVFVFDESLDETRNWRFNNLTSIAVAMTERLALKVSLELRYDNDPALIAISVLEAPGGPPTGEVVFVPAEELDTVLNAAFVVSF